MNIILESSFFYLIRCIKSIYEAFSPIILDKTLVLLHFVADSNLQMRVVALVIETGISIYVSKKILFNK